MMFLEPGANMYAFVVDTNEYAGNFERELTAYCTGRIGECSVGDEMAKVFLQDTGLSSEHFDTIIDVPDEHGHFRPTSIYPTPGYFNPGMGGEFLDGQEDAALAHYRKKVLEYRRQYPGSLLEVDENVLKKHPAYLSVAIYFGAKPSSEHVALIKERAVLFFSRLESGELKSRSWKPKAGSKILGYRLVEISRVDTELPLES